MKRHIVQLVSIACVLISSLFVGCAAFDPTEKRDLTRCCNLVSQSGDFIMLPAAEKRLMKAIFGQRIMRVSALCYTADEPSYLIIEGEFATDYGSVSDVFILRLEKASDAWETADVYRWGMINSDRSGLVDADGKWIKKPPVRNPWEFLILSEEDKKKWLKPIESAVWYKMQFEPHLNHNRGNANCGITPAD